MPCLSVACLRLDSVHYKIDSPIRLDKWWMNFENNPKMSTTLSQKSASAVNCRNLYQRWLLERGSFLTNDVHCRATLSYKDESRLSLHLGTPFSKLNCRKTARNRMSVSWCESALNWQEKFFSLCVDIANQTPDGSILWQEERSLVIFFFDLSKKWQFHLLFQPDYTCQVSMLRLHLFIHFSSKLKHHFFKKNLSKLPMVF